MDREIKRKPPVGKILGAVVAALICAFFLYGQLKSPRGQTFRVESAKLSIAEVSEGIFRDVTPIYGMAEPLRTVYLDAIEGGTVEQIYVREGAMLKVGDPIVRFSNTAFQLAAYTQEARISEQLDINANMRLSLDRNRLENLTRLNDIDLQIRSLGRRRKQAESLRERQVISIAEYEELHDQYEHQVRSREIMEQAQTRDESVRGVKIAELGEAEKRLRMHLQAVRRSVDQLVVRAPVSGQLTSLAVEAGEAKRSGDRLGQVDVLDGYKVRAEVDSFYLPRMRRGQEATLSLEDRMYRLSVDKLYREVKDGKFRVDFVFVGTLPPNLLRGQNLAFELQMSPPGKALLLKNGGFYQDTGGQWAFVVGSGGDVAVKRQLKLGRRSPNYIEILDGVKAGERVIVSSYASFANMDRLVLN
jgi:HlyD family secretion protein